MKINLIIAQKKIGCMNLNEAFIELESILSARDIFPNSLLVLPELWPCGFNRNALYAFAASAEEFIERLKQFATAHEIHIAVPVARKSYEDTRKLLNSFIFISSLGEVLSNYQKIHLFPLTHEPSIFTNGTKPVVLELEGSKIGFATCYDLRFPELFRVYAEKGVELVLVAACFPDPRQHDWSTLLQARAIENQYFVLGVNAVGNDQIETQTLTYFGHSALINPRGDQIIRLGREEGVASQIIDTTEVTQYKNQINFIKDRIYAIC